MRSRKSQKIEYECEEIFKTVLEVRNTIRKYRGELGIRIVKVTHNEV